MTSIKPHPNTNITPIYKIVIKETGEIVETFRSINCAINDLPRLKKIYPYDLEIQDIVTTKI